MCTEYIRKEANRLHWIVKGHLIPKAENDVSVERIYNSYFKRVWGNHENCVHETGFEQAYKCRKIEMLNDEIKYVAILGYN